RRHVRRIHAFRADTVRAFSRSRNAMRSRHLASWMWGDALSMLEQAERLHRQFFHTGPRDAHCWEPPVDVIERDDAIVVLVALPGVPADAISVAFDTAGVRVSGTRHLPASRT